MNEKNIKVEVAYAKPDLQVILPLDVPIGSTAKAAVEASGILLKFPEIDLTKSRMGVFGKAIKSDYLLREKDRVEIYRPLIADPKEVRRSRAEAGKAMKKGGGEAEKSATSLA